MSNENRILHISANRYLPLPSAHHTKRIWQELSKCADQYHVLARSVTNQKSLSQEENIYLHLVPALGKSQALFLITSLYALWICYKYRPTHILVQCPVFGGMAAVLCKLFFNAKVIIEFHGENYFKPTKTTLTGKLRFIFFKNAAKFSLNFCNRARSLSSEMTDHIKKIYGDKIAEKTQVVPNRVDLQVFNKVKNDYSLDGHLKIITVGSFIPGKNHLQLLTDLNSAEIDFHLTIVGTGPLKNSYFSLAQNLGIEQRLSIRENLSHAELAEALRQSDIYIHYSLTEAVSRAVMESMAMGVPTLLTNVGYLRDLITNNHNAIFVALDKNSLKSVLKKLIESEHMRKELGTNARTTIENQFEWNIVFDRYRKMIRETC